MAMWYNAKQAYESKFQSEIEQYGFVWNEEEFQEMERKAKEMCAALYIDKYNVE